MKIKVFVIVGLMLGAAVTGWAVLHSPVSYVDPMDSYFDSQNSGVEKTMMWHDVFVWTPLGEATPSGGTGVLSVFLLDYGADVSLLGDNSTDWSSDGNVHAYADSDGFSEDTPSEDPFRIVVRCRFTKAVCYDEGDSQFVGNRTKCTITFSGDESGTITHYGNHTEAASGGGICSYNDSGGDALFVNFYFNDGVDGYRVTDDGSLSIDSIVVAAKY